MFDRHLCPPCPTALGEQRQLTTGPGNGSEDARIATASLSDGLRACVTRKIFAPMTTTEKLFAHVNYWGMAQETEPLFARPQAAISEAKRQVEINRDGNPAPVATVAPSLTDKS